MLESNDASIRSPQRISRKILKTQYTDEFGGYSKTWFADGLKRAKNNEEMEQDGLEIDEDDQMGENAAEPTQDFGMDCLARNLGLDIEALARELAMQQDNRPPIQSITVQDQEVYNDYQNSLLKTQAVNKEETEMEISNPSEEADVKSEAQESITSNECAPADSHPKVPESRNSTPCIPLKEIAPGLLQKQSKNQFFSNA